MIRLDSKEHFRLESNKRKVKTERKRKKKSSNK